MGQGIKQVKGFMVVEVLISLLLAGLLIVTVMAVLSSTRKLQADSRYRQQALNYARQSLENVTAIASRTTSSNQFVCSPTISTGILVGDICTRNDGSGQTCTLPGAGYNSCWTPYPAGLTSNSQLQYNIATDLLEDGVETIGGFTRVITIDNLEGNSNTKKITVTVSWVSQGASKNISLSSVLAAWKNL